MQGDDRRGTLAISESQRRQLHGALVQLLGEQHADVLMEYLPPVPWADVARSSDIEALRAVQTSDLDQLRAAQSADMAQLRGEVGALREELRGEMGALREGLRGEMSALREELRGEAGTLREELRGELSSLRVEVADRFRQQTIVLVGATITVTGLLGATAFVA